MAPDRVRGIALQFCIPQRTLAVPTSTPAGYNLASHPVATSSNRPGYLWKPKWLADLGELCSIIHLWLSLGVFVNRDVALAPADLGTSFCRVFIQSRTATNCYCY